LFLDVIIITQQAVWVNYKKCDFQYELLLAYHDSNVGLLVVYESKVQENGVGVWILLAPQWPNPLRLSRLCDL
jgi:hypothetical protein